MTWLEVGPNECEFTTFILYDKKMMLAQKPSANVGSSKCYIKYR